jgi:hypothetical protein
MKAGFTAALLGATAALAVSGCGATDTDGARGAAEAFYGAYASKDGPAACEQLSESTREELVEEEQKPCEQAVLELKLSGERAVAEQAYITESKIELDGGDSAFVEETPDGWRVSAAGCKPVDEQEAPYDCEVES